MEDKIRVLELEIKQLKAQLKETESALIEKEKLALLGSMVPGISHEINTPLGVAVSAGSFLEAVHKRFYRMYETGILKKSDLENYFSNVSESSEIINKNLYRAVELIKNLKEVSVYQSNEMKVQFELYHHLETILKTLKHELKQGNHIYEIEGIEQSVYSYPGVFSQIITNLAMNSIHHGYKEMKNGLIKVTVETIEESLIITYRDDGSGISDKDYDYIFDPFFTTSRESGGTGLGLNIINQLVVNKLKGKIVCNNKLDKGVEFIITLPKSTIEKG